MKVYVVTSGDYSDYHVERIFTTQKLAQAFTDEHRLNEDVEEYEINDTAPKLVVDFVVRMFRDGTVECSWPNREWDDRPVTPDQPIVQPGRTAKNPLGMCFFVRTDDKNRAIKVANERRAQLIASGKWE